MGLIKFAEKNGSNNRSQKTYARPRADAFENDKEFLIVLDVPGVAKDGVDVRFEDGELTIDAPRAHAPQGSKTLAEEYRTSDYRRAFALPDGVDGEKIEATLANGVLSVHIPKAAAKRARRIDVRTT
jgi:HSP20 family protein